MERCDTRGRDDLDEALSATSTRGRSYPAALTVGEQAGRADAAARNAARCRLRPRGASAAQPDRRRSARLDAGRSVRAARAGVARLRWPVALRTEGARPSTAPSSALPPTAAPTPPSTRCRHSRPSPRAPGRAAERGCCAPCPDLAERRRLSLQSTPAARPGGASRSNSGDALRAISRITVDALASCVDCRYRFAGCGCVRASACRRLRPLRRHRCGAGPTVDSGQQCGGAATTRSVLRGERPAPLARGGGCRTGAAVLLPRN